MRFAHIFRNTSQYIDEMPFDRFMNTNSEAYFASVSCVVASASQLAGVSAWGAVV